MRGPVIVVGTGRCGSSAVARVLHEQLGVFMGERFDPPSASNPDGSYEDLDFRDLHVAFFRSEMALGEFRDQVERLMAVRHDARGAEWGFKDPRACHVLGLYLQWVSDVIVVEVRRDTDSVIDSIHRRYGTPVDAARRETFDRLAQLDRLRALVQPRLDVTTLDSDGPELIAVSGSPWFTVDMNEQRSDAEIRTALARSGWPGIPVDWDGRDDNAGPSHGAFSG